MFRLLRRRRRLLRLTITNVRVPHVKVCVLADMTTVERVIVAEVLMHVAADIDPREVMLPSSRPLECVN